MNYFKRLPGLLTVAVLFTFSSCKVEGPEGKPGKDGVDGNANVKTQIITVTPSNWNGDEYLYEAQKQCSIITADIVSSGAVLCYLQEENNTYVPLPFTFTGWYLNQQEEPVFYNTNRLFLYSPGVISFLLQDDDAMTPVPEDNYVFKVVTIASSELVAGVNTLDYKEVARALQLED